MRSALTDTGAATRRRRTLRRRLWGVRLVTVAAVAASLGLSTAEVSAQARSRSLAQIAAARGVPAAEIRATALRAADPLLDEAVRAGVIGERERLSLRRRIGERGTF